ncbi:hypothetical protein UlMin_020988 [Ulmus minor]
MEMIMNWEQETLINELNQGKEVAKQLMDHIKLSSSQETRDFLVKKILSSYEKALSMLKHGDSLEVKKPVSESPRSFSNSSPKSEIFDLDCSPGNVCKKRKIMPRWTKQVKIGSELAGSGGDGYSWRKYGQKDILGAKHPRGYYRCTHRNARGCLATKQVQKSDDDPSLFEVTYRGRHTCGGVSQLAMVSFASPIKQDSKLDKTQLVQLEEEEEEEEPKPTQEPSFNLGAGLKVKTEDLDTKEDAIFPSFSFPSSPFESNNFENQFFSEMIENDLVGSFSSPFISPTTSESNYFSLSPCPMSSFGLGNNVQTSDADLTEIPSAPTSVTNSPINDLDSILDSNFEWVFPFESSEFLC